MRRATRHLNVLDALDQSAAVAIGWGRLQAVTGGEPRAGHLTGTKALMLAVLEDGIRCYLGGTGLIAQNAELWIGSSNRQSPFSFVVVCEILGLEPTAVRERLARMKERRITARRALPRSRRNVRMPGRVIPWKRH